MKPTNFDLFASFTPFGSYFTLDIIPTSSSHEGTYILKVIVTDNNTVGDSDGVKSTEYDVYIVIGTQNSAPVFVSELTTSISLQVGVDFENLVLPTFTDADVGDSHVLTFTSTNPLYTLFTTNTD